MKLYLSPRTNCSPSRSVSNNCLSTKSETKRKNPKRILTLAKCWLATCISELKTWLSYHDFVHTIISFATIFFDRKAVKSKTNLAKLFRLKKSGIIECSLNKTA